MRLASRICPPLIEILLLFPNLIPNLQLPRKPLILWPPQHPWSAPSYSISYQLSSPCSSNDPPSIRNAGAVSYLSTLPHSDITSWTDGSVPSGLGKGAEIYINCTKCLTAAYLSFSAGCWASRCSAETYAIRHVLEWCITYSSPVVDYVALFSDSQSILTTLSTPLPYLILKSFTNTQSLLNSLSDSKIVGSVDEWLKHRTDDQHGLGSKPTCTILLCP